MINPLIIISLLLSFVVTVFSLPYWMKRVKKAGLTGKDMNKKDSNEIPELGGVIVVFGFIIGVLFYIAIKVFYFKDISHIVEIFSIISVILLVSFVGFVDDILGWKIGLNKQTRILLILFCAIPLIVINAGQSEIFVPFDGKINLGLIYPLILIPIAIVGTTTTYNFLAGYNGLEASQGIIILSSLSFVSWKIGQSWLSVISLYMILSLIAFYLFNKYPSKIFPGDIMTYSIGAMISIMAIFGNMERIAIFFFIPYIIEVCLKLRGRLKKESFSKVKDDGSLDLPYEKIYGLEHLAIKILKKIKKEGKVYEKEVVYLINGFQIIIILLGLIIFRNSIF